MSAQHTLGPWTVKPSDTDGHFSVESAQLIEGDYVAEVYDETDAYLIGAAPQLLAALQKTESRLEAMALLLDRARRAMEDSNARCRDLAGECQDVLDEERGFIVEARAAIAKTVVPV